MVKRRRCGNGPQSQSDNYGNDSLDAIFHETPCPLYGIELKPPAGYWFSQSRTPPRVDALRRAE